MELAHLVGWHSAAYWVHNRTLPSDVREAGLMHMRVEAGEYFHTNSGMTAQEVEAVMRLHKELSDKHMDRKARRARK